jgi:hypothetical protein
MSKGNNIGGGPTPPPDLNQGGEPELKPLPASPLAGYTEYEEYKLSVETFTKKIPGVPGAFFDRYEMRIEGKKRDKIRVEAKRAERLNTKMHDRKLVFIPTGGKIPISITRKLRDDGNGEINGGYSDKFNY